MVASIRNQDASKGGTFLLPKQHILDAATALNMAGIMAVLAGRTDDQDKLKEREVLTNSNLRDWLRNHEDPEYRKTGQILQAFSGLTDCWDRSGLDKQTRDMYAQNFNDLFEAAAGTQLRLPVAPPGKTLGMSSNLLFVLSANLSSRRAFQVAFPDQPLKERNVGTYACEGYFSSLVVSNGGHKPTAQQAVHLMQRSARLNEIRFQPDRPFYEVISKHQHYDHAANALAIGSQRINKMVAWNDGSALAITDRSRECGKKRKGVCAETHLVTQAQIRAYHKKRQTI